MVWKWKIKLANCAAAAAAALIARIAASTLAWRRPFAEGKCSVLPQRD
jgi:hypothetical protein